MQVQALDILLLPEEEDQYLQSFNGMLQKREDLEFSYRLIPEKVRCLINRGVYLVLKQFSVCITQQQRAPQLILFIKIQHYLFRRLWVKLD
jgi:hypothetical protein